MAIQFTSHEVKDRLKDKRRLKGFLKDLFAAEGQDLKSLHYIFCNDAYLLEINQQFLKHDTYTDIVTFEMGEDPGITEGEIYVSTDRVEENAEKFGVPYEQELHRVIFHGALHLCGFKDKSKKEAELMRSKENEYLSKYFGA
ncbi:rRNA maturation RNase YbeY [Chitinophaga terrae (ex Kim and Jung 2007)]|uniref:Endoribonuclease YbeY n=1 Tax=Chitinophaga terrae (ex Kim and Jung 2007) TaxID=408074 RepID=A0A1H4E9Y9_9BACT|nr:rRNA maturation RNase YbeY [Chitinophaga terrae (ex Kim and Jung 2007)]GEP91495.1 endoribonuclease YbeY [Chitinophaga terrae (ex Kim and Jung 2007)]SEA81851.1 rRNA maturation RNase YbeY [Chitinophaga terrae (ex Kim and Jung 2007)]